MRIVKSTVPGGKPSLSFNQGRKTVSVGETLTGRVLSSGLQSGTRVSIEIRFGNDTTCITPLMGTHSFRAGQTVYLMVEDIGDKGQIRTTFVDPPPLAPAPGPIAPPTPKVSPAPMPPTPTPSPSPIPPAMPAKSKFAVLSPTQAQAPAMQAVILHGPASPVAAISPRPKLADLLAQIAALPTKIGTLDKPPLVMVPLASGIFDEPEPAVVYGTILYPEGASYPRSFTFARVGTRNAAHGKISAYVEVGYLKALAALWADPRQVTLNARINFSYGNYIPQTTVSGNEYFYEISVEGGHILLKSSFIGRTLSSLSKPAKDCSFSIRISFSDLVISQLNLPGASLFDQEYPYLDFIPNNLQIEVFP
ncbi:MAG: hypothetical protein WC890_06235 [Candidatus Margulisiibacteriota bacterium]